MRYLCLLFAVCLGLCAGCAHPSPDLSQLSSQGRQDFDVSELVKKVNDVDTAVRAAYDAGTISATFAAQAQTITKQVRDYFRATPQGTRAQAITIVSNAKQALPEDVRTAIDGYIQQVIDILSGVR